MPAFSDLAAPTPAESAAPAAPSGGTGSGGGAFSDLANRIGGAASAVGGAASSAYHHTPLPWVVDLMDRQRQASQAALAGDHPGRTLIHGAGPDQQAANRAAIEKRAGVDLDDATEGGPFGAFLNSLAHGVMDLATDTVTDPVSYETLGVGAAGRAGATALRGAGGLATRAAPKLAKEVGEYAHAVQDWFTPGGSARRELGAPRFNAAIAADNRQSAREAEAARRLTERFESTIKPLSDDERVEVYRALNGERQLTDPASGRSIVAPHVMAAYKDLRKLTQDAAALQATDEGRRRLAFGRGRLAPGNLADRVEPQTLSYERRTPPTTISTRPGLITKMTHADDAPKAARTTKVTRADRSYALPDDLQEFAAPSRQGMLGPFNIRANYLPGPHLAKDVAEDRPASTFNILRPFAGNAIPRDAFEVRADDLGKLDDAFRASLLNAARQGTAGRLRAELGVPLDLNAANREPTALERLFQRDTAATGDARSTAQKAGERWRQFVDIPKNTVTVLGPKHGLVNVPALAAQAEGPAAALEAIARGRALAGMKPGERYEALRPGIEGGVIAPFADRANPIADALTRLPGPLGKMAGGATEYANNLTWAIDDAAKQAVLERKLARGMDPASAAAETLHDMVDYRHRSAATKAAAMIAPFATFRTKIPGALLSSIARNPARFLAMNRASQGLLAGGSLQFEGPDGQVHTLSMSTPQSDVTTLTNEPQRYGRAMLTDPARAALSPIALPGRDSEGDWKMRQRYSTYGEPLLPHVKDGQFKSGFLLQQLAGYVPFGLGEDALNAVGAGEFPKPDWISMLLGPTLGAHVR